MISEGGKLKSSRLYDDRLDASVLRKLLTMGKHILTESDVDKLLDISVDDAIKISGAERGMIILFDENGDFRFVSARKLNKVDIERPQFEVSRTIIDQVKTEGKTIYLMDAFEDPAFKMSKSIAKLKILSVICLPLSHRGDVFGVVYLDNRSVRGVFRQATYAFVSEFADFISLAAYRALERKRIQNHVISLEEELRGKYRFESIVGHHPKIVEILKLVSQVADTDATVLIQGESGTGKELIARALHFNGGRGNKPFVPINCGALPENLLESELFGHVRGAFTGAVKDKLGWFERADGGTIFLDEVNEMTPALQVRLLRILQTGEYSRVGSTDIRHCDVRVVAATNQNLQDLVQAGSFREEVYYRLKVIDLFLPPLRERRCDIPLLSQHFLEEYGRKYGKEKLNLSKEVEAVFSEYGFPGNVRELENAIQRAVVLIEGREIQMAHLPESFHSRKATDVHHMSWSFAEAKRAVIDRFEKTYIEKALQDANGVVARAARSAGMDAKNFYQKMEKYSIIASNFKK